MNKIRVGNFLYINLKRRKNDLELEIFKLERLKTELKEIESLLISTKNYEEELDEKRF